MPCKLIHHGDFTMIICGPEIKCAYCGKPHTSFCDYPLLSLNGKTETCDVPMCNDCKTTIGDNLDVCKNHNKPKYIKETLEANKDI